MKLVKVSHRKVVNIAMIAWADRNAAGQVTAHFPVRRAALVDGAPRSPGAPVGTEHVPLVLSGGEAEALWDALISSTG